MEHSFASEAYLQLQKSYNKIYSYLILSVVLIVFFYEMKRRTKFQSITVKIKTLYGLPFIGIGYKFIQVKKLLYKLGRILENQSTHTMFSWLGPHPLIVTQDYEIIEHVLTSSDFLEKSTAMYKCFRYIFGNGLIASSVTKWKHNRKSINYFFNQKNLNKSIPAFVNALDVTLNKLDKLCGKAEEDVFDALLYAPMLSTVAIVYGNTERAEDILQDFVYITKYLALDLHLSPFGLNFLAHTKRYANLHKKYKKYLEDLTLCVERNADGNIIEGPHPVFLNHVYELYNKGDFTPDDIVDEVMTLTQASFDITHKTICSVLVLLAMHPAVQQKVYEEITAHYSSTDQKFQYEDLKSIPYLDMIINETLRLFPTVPVIARQAICKTHLIDDIIVPSGMQVGILLYNLHRRKDIWGADAELFKPEHCHPEKLSKIHPYAFIPYSKGARGCIGWRYGNLALRVFLLGILRNFKFSTSYKYADLKYRADISIAKLMLKIERR